MKKLRKAWLPILCAILLAAGIALPPTAGAAELSVLSIGSVGGQRGESVTLEVALNEVNGIAGGGFNILYDHTLLQLESAVAGEAMTGASPIINSQYTEGTIRFTFAKTTELAQAGVMLRLTFRINENAPLGDIPVTAEKVKLYDVNANVVSREWTAGSVGVQAVTIALSSDNCLPGQSVKLALTLDGPLAPCGGEFEIHYNSRLLTAGSVKAEDKMGDVGINLSYNIDEANSRIMVSWASTYPVTEMGQLCTVIFAVSESAAGETPVTIENVRFFNEMGRKMDANEPIDGLVTVVSSYNAEPVLYVVGGILHKDGKTATAQIAIDGAGLVCGGRFNVSFDTSACTLDKMTVKKATAATNPEIAAAVNGQITVTWAEDSPALDNETILELDFTLTTDKSVELLLSDVKFHDKTGAPMDDVQVHSGEVGITSSLQAPVTQARNTEDTMGVEAILYDAQFCTSTVTESAKVILAAYCQDRMQTVTLPQGAISFDHNGIAQVNVDLPFDSAVDELQLFVLDAAGGMSPLCEKAEVQIAG